MTNKQLSKLIVKVRKRMNGKDGTHWAKRAYSSKRNWKFKRPEDGESCVCINQAIAEVIGEEFGTKISGSHTGRVFIGSKAKAHAAAREVQEAILDRSGLAEKVWMPVWYNEPHVRLALINDDPKIDWDTMSGGLTKAARSLR